MTDQNQQQSQPQQPASAPPAAAGTSLMDLLRGPLTLERILLAGVLGVGSTGVVGGSSKLDAMRAEQNVRLEAIEQKTSATSNKLDALGNALADLKAKREADEKLDIDRRLRAVEIELAAKGGGK